MKNDRRLGKKIKKIIALIICSLVLQLVFYTLLDFKLARVLSPEKFSSTVEFIIPSTKIESPKISPSKRYFAYFNNNTLEIFDVVLKKVLYRQGPAQGGQVLDFDWLPDRDGLLYICRGQPKTSPATEDTTDGVHLFTLEFDRLKESPDVRYHSTLTHFPINAEIEKMVFSTYANIVYIALKDNASSMLLEIDVMKDTRIISRSQEVITNMVVSNESGILYVESSIASGSKKISAVNGWKRSIIDDNSHRVLLGCRLGTLYLGTVIEDKLLEITRLPIEQQGSPSFEVIWRGELPFKGAQVVITDANIPILLHENSLFLLREGLMTKTDLAGSQFYLSEHAQVLVKMFPKGDHTVIHLIPLEKFWKS